MRIDGAAGKPEFGPLSLGKIAFSGNGRGPAIAAADDGAVFVASTQIDGEGFKRRVLSRVRFGDPFPIKTWFGWSKTLAHAVAVAGDVVIVVGAAEVQPGTHDLKVWWHAADDGELLHEEKFAAPSKDDPNNTWDEVARGVAIVGGEVVVVGEHEKKDDDLNEIVRRTVVLRYGLDGELLGEWSSLGEYMDEDAGMAVAPLRGGGFIVTGWGRNKGIPERRALTRWFTATGEPGPVRIEATTTDAVGFAVAEDREGKIIVSGTILQPLTDRDAWVFAIPGPLGAPAWEVVRNGPGQGPDEAAGLAVDAWGYSYIVGSEFEALQPRAFALRLYP